MRLMNVSIEALVQVTGSKTPGGDGVTERQQCVSTQNWIIDYFQKNSSGDISYRNATALQKSTRQVP